MTSTFLYSDDNLSLPFAPRCHEAVVDEKKQAIFYFLFQVWSDMELVFDSCRFGVYFLCSGAVGGRCLRRLGIGELQIPM
jgi:hypothetical protein